MSTQADTSPVSEATAMYDVVVVGAGFSGVYQLWHLRERGFSVILFEAGSGLGGVWNLNRYPGARVDSDGIDYQFSHERFWKNWDMSERFPDHRELRDYFAYLESQLDLCKDCRFNTKVVAADFNDSECVWTLTTSDGSTTRTRYVVFATGSTVEPYRPDFPGTDDYQGTLVHTARWPEGLEYAGKRVAVIGTGASGVQMIQEIGPVAEQLTVFQRTPNLSLPMRQRRLTAADNVALREAYPETFARRNTETFAGFSYDFDPRKAVELSDEEREKYYEQCWQEGGLRLWLAGFIDTLFDHDANKYAYEFWKKKIRACIKDPAKADLLAPHEPPHPFGTKREALHQNYYEVMNQDNVEIVPVRETPIERFTETGIRTADGRERVFDVVVLATGYDNNTGALTAIDVRGTDGRTLREKWVDGVDVYLGALTQGYPNLVFLYGPQSPAAFGNGPTSAELQGDEVINLLEYMRQHGHTRFESTRQADEAWTAEIDAIDDVALLKYADSWYNASNIPGKHRQMLQYLGGFPTYMQRWQTERESGYTKGLVLG
ncbi:MAG: SidA/IucD/PvdA family monooxygenase [Pseudonocardiaceae bacterium]|nr:SidA/IucD/PvdA family monooxygenase [Pseudonocardiaceae bacterium]